MTVVLETQILAGLFLNILLLFLLLLAHPRAIASLNFSISVLLVIKIITTTTWIYIRPFKLLKIRTEKS